MANIEFEQVNCANRLKSVVAGSLKEFPETNKYSIRALVEGPDENGEVSERICFVGWKRDVPAPEIGCRLQMTKWTDIEGGREGYAYTPIVLDNAWTMPKEVK